MLHHVLYWLLNSHKQDTDFLWAPQHEMRGSIYLQMSLKNCSNAFKHQTHNKLKDALGNNFDNSVKPCSELQRGVTSGKEVQMPSCSFQLCLTGRADWIRGSLIRLKGRKRPNGKSQPFLFMEPNRRNHKWPQGAAHDTTRAPPRWGENLLGQKAFQVGEGETRNLREAGWGLWGFWCGATEQ